MRDNGKFKIKLTRNLGPGDADAFIMNQRGGFFIGTQPMEKFRTDHAVRAPFIGISWIDVFLVLVVFDQISEIAGGCLFQDKSFGGGEISL